MLNAYVTEDYILTVSERVSAVLNLFNKCRNCDIGEFFLSPRSVCTVQRFLTESSFFPLLAFPHCVYFTVEAVVDSMIGLTFDRSTKYFCLEFYIDAGVANSCNKLKLRCCWRRWGVGGCSSRGRGSANNEHFACVERCAFISVLIFLEVIPFTGSFAQIVYFLGSVRGIANNDQGWGFEIGAGSFVLRAIIGVLLACCPSYIYMQYWSEWRTFVSTFKCAIGVLSIRRE